MNAMQNFSPRVQDPIPDMVVDAARTVLPTLHTQINQVRLNTLQVRQAAIKAADQCMRASLEADKQFFELAQAILPIAHNQFVQVRMSMLEVHDASIAAMNQAMEQSMKTDQQLYDACLELLNKDVQQEGGPEDLETEEEIEVVPDEEFVEEEDA